MGDPGFSEAKRKLGSFKQVPVLAPRLSRSLLNYWDFPSLADDRSTGAKDKEEGGGGRGRSTREGRGKKISDRRNRGDKKKLIRRASLDGGADCNVAARNAQTTFGVEDAARHDGYPLAIIQFP